MIPPREAGRRQFYWLLLVATHGLVNANAKWQVHSDGTFEKLRLKPTIIVPHLFFRKDGLLKLLVAKVTDDMLIGGPKEERQKSIEQLHGVYEIGTITHIPGKFLFFGLVIEQDEECFEVL